MSSEAMLQVAVQHRMGALTLDLALTLTRPWTVLFAPSGAGKTTVLRIIAGLARAACARVAAGDKVLCDTKQAIWVPPHLRRIPFLGQNPALFPHRTVEQNVAYGMTERSADRVAMLLSLCRAEHLAGKMPAQLSGGEKQRIGLARALAPRDTRLLLLDEPFSGLDVALRDDLMENLQAWLKHEGTPVLQVTHDVGEVFALGAEVVQIDEGRVVAQGRPELVLSKERDLLLRRFEGCHDGTPSQAQSA